MLKRIKCILLSSLALTLVVGFTPYQARADTRIIQVPTVTPTPKPVVPTYKPAVTATPKPTNKVTTAPTSPPVINNNNTENNEYNDYNYNYDNSTHNYDYSQHTYITYEVDLTGVETRLDDIKQEAEETKKLIERIKKEEELLHEWLMNYAPAVTNIYSINNRISGCYYKPKFDDIPNLEAYILKDGFLAAYGGYFDLDNDGVYVKDTPKLEDVNKENGVTRALEILGYDFLLANEELIRESSTNLQYSITMADEVVDYTTAVMDIYKALGKYIYDVSINYVADPTIRLGRSPVTESIASGLILNLDTSRGKAEVFVTRTNREKYVERACTEFTWTPAQYETAISNREFIVLLAHMMNLYGEPVLSTLEQNLLLQVYGGGIPTSLTVEERDAYLYLKSRGVLNVDLDYNKDLNLYDMLDILMCVADKDSRTNWKEIQPVFNVDSSLIDVGYFPKTASLAVDDKALVISDPKYDYSESDYYDYYVFIEEGKTKFVKQTSGNGWSSQPTYRLFVSASTSTATNKWDKVAEDSAYLGIKKDDEGNSYYHFRVPTTFSLSYKGGNYILINTLDGYDNPTKMWLPAGGGIYWSEEEEHADAPVLSRRPFNEGEFLDSVDKERRYPEQQTASIFSRVVDFLLGNPITAKAAKTPNRISVTEERTVTHKIGSLSGGGISTEVIKEIKAIDNSIFVDYDEVTGNLIIRCKVGMWSKIVEKLSTIQDTPANSSYMCLASLEGDLLIPYDNLVEAGVIKDMGRTPYTREGEDHILILESYNGLIKINQDTREILVGSVLYKVTDEDAVLFYYDVDTESGESKLYVDFRVAYGWTSNNLNIAVTGTGENYKVSLSKGGSVKLSEVSIWQPNSFKSSTMSALERHVKVVPKNALGNNDFPGILMSSHYSLSNYFIFEGFSGVDGKQVTRLFVFYPNGTVDESKENIFNGLKVLNETLGYNLGIDEFNWVVGYYDLDPNNDFIVQGTFQWVENLGWVYWIPNSQDFTMQDYLNGTFLLPLARSVSTIVDYNVNTFTGYDYGTRPGKTSKGDVISVDIYGNITEGTFSLDTIKDIGIAPAGISNLFCTSKLSVITLKDAVKVSGISSDDNPNVKYFIGSQRFFVESESKDSIIGYVSFQAYGSSKEVKIQLSLDSSCIFYKVSDIQQKGSEDVITYVMMDTDSNTRLKASTLQGEKVATEYEVDVDITGFEDGKEYVEYTEFDKFNLDSMVSSVDSKANFLIRLATEIMPTVLIICATLTMTFAVLADAPFVRTFCNKVIDPVKILTLNIKTIDTITLTGSFWGCMIIYISCVLIMDGNAFKLIEWGLNLYSRIIERF